MKTLIYRTLALAALTAAIAAQGTISAQVRRRSPETSQTGSTSSGTDDTKRQAPVRRSSSGTSSGRSYSSPQVVRRSPGNTSSGSTNSSSTTVRRGYENGSSNQSTVRRSYENSGASSQSTVRRSSERGSSNQSAVRRGYENSSSSGQSTVRRSSERGSSVTRSSSQDNSTVRRSSSSSERPIRTVRYDDVRNVRTSGSSDSGNKTVTRSSVFSNTGSDDVRRGTNVTRRGLGSVSSNDDRSNSGAQRDYSGARSAQAQRMRVSDDDFRINDNRDVMRVPPREREYVSYERLGRFYNDDFRYYGYRVEYLPPRYTRVRYYGVDYYYYNDVYYRPYGDHYIVCRPPVGISISARIGNLRFSIVNFAYYNHVYRTYSGWNSYYDYIDRQNLEIARNNAILAEQNRQIAMNWSLAQNSYSLASQLGLVQSYAYANRDYYYQDGVFYIINNGQYQVIVPPAGALVDSLPDDYDTIVLNGNEYYRVDDTVYRLTLVNGEPCLEVLGQTYR